MNKNLVTFKNRARSIAAKAGAVVAGTAAAAGSAMAQTAALSDGFSTEVAAQKGELLIIGGLVLGVCAIVFLIMKARRTSGG